MLWQAGRQASEPTDDERAYVRLDVTDLERSSRANVDHGAQRLTKLQLSVPCIHAAASAT